MKNSARFTERASGAIAAARDASASLGHSYVGTEHLLLGVAAETEGLGARVLLSRGLDMLALTRLVELLSLMSASGLEPKRLRLVQHRLEKPPGLVLVEGRKGARPGLEVLPALILTGPDGRDAAEMRRIYHREEN